MQLQAPAFRPELVAFTAVTCEATTVLRLASELKESIGAKVVVGGSHASSDPTFFNRPGIDYVVVGLGKGSLAELVAAIEAGRPAGAIPGVAATRPVSRPQGIVIPRRSIRISKNSRAAAAWPSACRRISVRCDGEMAYGALSVETTQSQWPSAALVLPPC